MGDHDGIGRKFFFCKIAVQGIKKITHPVIYIRGTFAIGDAEIKSAVTVPLSFNFNAFFQGAQVPPLLLTQAGLFPMFKLCFGKMFSYLAEGLPGAVQGRYIELYLFIF